jgi:hypothetical protein
MIDPSLRSTSVMSEVHAHSPEVHAAPAPHASPQPPQFAGSVAASMHAPPQSRPLEGHAQTPLVHFVPPPHA